MEQLYLKYKPLKWSEIIGQTPTVKDLISRLKSNKLPQVVYLSGISGVGKTSVGYILARSLVCSNISSEGEPCNSCSECMSVISEDWSHSVSYFDGYALDTAEVRSMGEKALSNSLTSPRKVFIINELQGLLKNDKAIKSLLTILEKDYGDHTYFILLSMEDIEMKSLRSRMVHYYMSPLKITDLAQAIRSICEKEGVDLDSPEKIQTVMTVARSAEGSFRMALAFLDRVISGDLWNSPDLLHELGVVSEEEIVIILKKILNGDISALKNEITPDMIRDMRFRLILLYKQKAGLQLDNWQIQKIADLQQASTSPASITLKAMNSLQNYVYLDRIIIDTVLVDVIMQNKK